MIKIEEKYVINVEWYKDYMRIGLDKNTEHPGGLYRIDHCELQMWQSKERLVSWLRRIADEVEKSAS